MTHSYLLKREPQPECVPCQTPLTVEHILLNCVDFNLSRQRYFNVVSLGELFQARHLDGLFAFLKEINIYSKL